MREACSRGSSSAICHGGPNKQSSSRSISHEITLDLAKRKTLDEAIDEANARITWILSEGLGPHVGDSELGFAN